MIRVKRKHLEALARKAEKIMTDGMRVETMAIFCSALCSKNEL